MKSWRSGAVENCATDQVRSVAPMPMAQPGLLYLVTPHDVQGLRSALAQGRLPADLETKLARLAGGNLSERYVEQNCRLIVALLLAAQENSFTQATPADWERLLRVLAYVRKDDVEVMSFISTVSLEHQGPFDTFAEAFANFLSRVKAMVTAGTSLQALETAC